MLSDQTLADSSTRALTTWPLDCLAACGDVAVEGDAGCTFPGTGEFDARARLRFSASMSAGVSWTGYVLFLAAIDPWN
jgi:hypothetical protein